MSAQPGILEGDHLDVLVTLVKAYEKKRYPLDFPDPVEAIKFVMDRGEVLRSDRFSNGLSKPLHRGHVGESPGLVLVHPSGKT